MVLVVMEVIVEGRIVADGGGCGVGMLVWM